MRNVSRGVDEVDEELSAALDELRQAGEGDGLRRLRAHGPAPERTPLRIVGTEDRGPRRDPQPRRRAVDEPRVEHGQALVERLEHPALREAGNGDGGDRAQSQGDDRQSLILGPDEELRSCFDDDALRLEIDAVGPGGNRAGSVHGATDLRRSLAVWRAGMGNEADEVVAVLGRHVLAVEKQPDLHVEIGGGLERGEEERGPEEDGRFRERRRAVLAVHGNRVLSTQRSRHGSWRSGPPGQAGSHSSHRLVASQADLQPLPSNAHVAPG